MHCCSWVYDGGETQRASAGYWGPDPPGNSGNSEGESACWRWQRMGVLSHSWHICLALLNIQVMDRQIWRSALEVGNYELLTSDGRENTGMNGRVEAMEVDCAHLRARDRCVVWPWWSSTVQIRVSVFVCSKLNVPVCVVNMCLFFRLQEVKSDSSAAYGSSGSGTPQVVSSSVRILAQALAHIEQGIDRRFLKAPLGEFLSRPGFVMICKWCQRAKVTAWEKSRKGQNVGGTKTITATCLYVLKLSTYFYCITTAADEDSKKDHKMKNKKKKDEDQASDGMTDF